MSMRVGEVVGDLRRGRFDARRHQRPRALGPMIAAEGLDRARRRVDDRQRRARRRRRHDALLGQHHSAYRAADDARRDLTPGRQLECRGRRARPLYRPDARRPRTVGTHLFLLFITSRCDMRESMSTTLIEQLEGDHRHRRGQPRRPRPRRRPPSQFAPQARPVRLEPDRRHARPARKADSARHDRGAGRPRDDHQRGAQRPHVHPRRRRRPRE